MLILFLHGWRSIPGGVKPAYLTSNGHEVLNPALPDDDFDEAVRIAQAEFDRHQPDLIVGSSRGGAVAMNINSGKAPLILLCPAWKRWGTATAVKPGTVVLHSPGDEVIPFADSRELLRNSGLSELRLIAVGHEHRLADPESLAKMLTAVERTSSPKTPLVGHEEAGVPRRFGIGTLLLITAMYAVLFAVLRVFHAPPFVFVEIAGFFTAVGLGQMFLFKGQRPRRASVIVGVGFYVAMSIFFWVDNRLLGRGVFVLFLINLVEGLFFGALFGYLAGVMIAGVFLMSDKLRNVRDKSRGRGSAS
jgi:hypothetical protein